MDVRETYEQTKLDSKYKVSQKIQGQAKQISLFCKENGRDINHFWKMPILKEEGFQMGFGEMKHSLHAFFRAL